MMMKDGRDLAFVVSSTVVAGVVSIVGTSFLFSFIIENLMLSTYFKRNCICQLDIKKILTRHEKKIVELQIFLMV